MVFQFTNAQSRVIGKCKICKQFSYVEDMVIDEVDNKAYHKKCKDNQQKQKENDNA